MQEKRIARLLNKLIEIVLELDSTKKRCKKLEDENKFLIERLNITQQRITYG